LKAYAATIPRCAKLCDLANFFLELRCATEDSEINLLVNQDEHLKAVTEMAISHSELRNGRLATRSDTHG
jgi:hypothetical protein